MHLLHYVVRNMHLIRCMSLNKQVSQYVVLPFFSNNTSIVTFVLTGYGFMLPCIRFVHLAILDHSMPNCVKRGQSVVSVVLKSYVQGSDFIFSYNCALALSPHFDIDCRIMMFTFELLTNYEGS